MGLQLNIAATGEIITPNGKKIDYHELFRWPDFELCSSDIREIVAAENPLENYIQRAQKREYWDLVDGFREWLNEKKENGFKIEVYYNRE